MATHQDAADVIMDAIADCVTEVVPRLSAGRDPSQHPKWPDVTIKEVGYWFSSESFQVAMVATIPLPGDLPASKLSDHTLSQLYTVQVGELPVTPADYVSGEQMPVRGYNQVEFEHIVSQRRANAIAALDRRITVMGLRADPPEPATPTEEEPDDDSNETGSGPPAQPAHPLAGVDRGPDFSPGGQPPTAESQPAADARGSVPE